MPYLQKNTKGTWRVRREIPSDVRESFGGKRWFIKSLGTRNPNEADQKSIIVLAEFEAKLDRIRRGEVYWGDRQGEEEDVAAFMIWLNDVAPLVHGDPYRFESRNEFLESVRTYVTEKELPISGRDFDQFIEYIETYEDGLYWSDQKRAPDSRILHPSPIIGEPTTPMEIRLSALCAELIDGERYSERTARDVNRSFKLLMDLHGDVYIHSVGRKHALEFVEILLKLPVKGRSRTLMRKPIRELAERDWDHTMSPKSVKKLVGFIRKGFRRAVQLGYISTNPFQDLWVSETNTSRSIQRSDFRPHQLRRLFKSPLFTGCKSERIITKPGATIIRDHRYWFPWLALYTGARLGELTQLETTNVRHENGIPFIEIIPTSDLEGAVAKKHLKTESSRRVVPIHKHLVELGFLQYCESKGSGLLFPSHYGSPDGLAHEYTKRFGYYLDQIGLSDPTLVFHSFRHGFKTACRMANIPEPIHDELTGHAPTSVGARYGERRRKIPMLKELIDLIEYEGIDGLESIVSRHE